MSRLFHRFNVFVLLLVFGLWLGLVGCASLSGKVDGKANAEAPPDEWQVAMAQLRQGMSMDDVRARLGPPRETKLRPGSKVVAQIWVYERRRVMGSTMQSTGTHDVPYVDPFTGLMRMIPEPTYSQVDQILVEEIELLWANGQLQRWTKAGRVESKING